MHRHAIAHAIIHARFVDLSTWSTGSRAEGSNDELPGEIISSVPYLCVVATEGKEGKAVGPCRDPGSEADGRGARLRIEHQSRL